MKTHYRNALVGPCSARKMFEELIEKGWGWSENSALWSSIILPANVVLVQERGVVRWGCLMRDRVENEYFLARPLDAQRAQRRKLSDIGWIALIRDRKEE